MQRTTSSDWCWRWKNSTPSIAGIRGASGPVRSHLSGPGHQLLEIGRVHFDVLGTIDDGLVYSDLLPDSVVMEVAGHHLRVLSLEKLIEIKRKLDRPKDKFMLLHLEATLDERRKDRRGPDGT